MYCYPQRLQFLAATEPLDQAAPEAVKSPHDYGHPFPPGREVTDVFEHLAVGGAIVALAAHHVDVFTADDPPLTRSIRASLPDLRIEAHSVPLAFRGDT